MKFKCKDCYLSSHCVGYAVPIVNDAEIGDWKFVRAIREFISSVYITPSKWLEAVHDLNRDLKVGILDQQGFCIDLDMSPLETDPEDQDLLEVCMSEERFRDYFRSLRRPMKEGLRPYVRKEAWERFRIIATLLIAWNPHIDWPRILPANDNISAANDNGT